MNKITQILKTLPPIYIINECMSANHSGSACMAGILTQLNHAAMDRSICLSYNQRCYRLYYPGVTDLVSELVVEELNDGYDDAANETSDDESQRTAEHVAVDTLWSVGIQRQVTGGVTVRLRHIPTLAAVHPPAPLELFEVAVLCHHKHGGMEVLEQWRATRQREAIAALADLVADNNEVAWPPVDLVLRDETFNDESILVGARPPETVGDVVSELGLAGLGSPVTVKSTRKAGAYLMSSIWRCAEYLNYSQYWGIWLC